MMIKLIILHKLHGLLICAINLANFKFGKKFINTPSVFFGPVNPYDPPVW